MARGCRFARILLVPLAAGCHSAERAVPPAPERTDEGAEGHVSEVAATAEAAPEFTDEALRDALREARGDQRTYAGVDDRALIEILRRGGADWERTLREEVRVALEAGPDADERVPDLAVLAVLRRLQRRRDPLEVAVDGLDGAEITWPHLPDCTVTLRNVDEEGISFRLTIGGDYRTGRYGRFRFEVRDARGTVVPVLQRWGMMGGMFTRQPLKPGGTWEAGLRMSDYVSVPAPGAYTVRVQYHDAEEIANADDVDGRLVYSSREMRFVSKPRVIEVSGADRARIAARVAALDEAADLVIPPPGSDGSGVFAGDSPQARILAEGWKSVPVLVESLQAAGASARRRAWIFGLLFTLTGANDPTREEGVLDEYSIQSAGVHSRRDGEPSGGISGKRERRERGTEIDAEAQAALADRWSKFVQTLEVRRRE